MINVFLRVYSDVFRQSLRFNFRRSKQSSFYVFGLLVDGRGGGSILTYLEKVCVVICAHQNRVRSIFLEFLLIVEGGGTPDKRISEGLFGRFPTKFTF